MMTKVLDAIADSFIKIKKIMRKKLFSGIVDDFHLFMKKIGQILVGQVSIIFSIILPD
jgi:hypothetical protein